MAPSECKGTGFQQLYQILEYDFLTTFLIYIDAHIRLEIRLLPIRKLRFENQSSQ